MSTIRQDVATDTDYSEGADATDAFEALWGLDAPNEPSEDTEDDDKKKPLKADEDTEEEDHDAEGDDEASEETPEDDEDAEGDEDEGDDDNDAPTIDIKDEHKIKVTVDGEEREFTLGSLKRLAGQEASLTRKSQEVATLRKTVDTRAATQLGQYNVLVNKANEKWAQFKDLDFLALSKDPNISQEELVAVRNAAKAAYEDVQFLTGDMERFSQALQHQQKLDLMEQAKEALKVLSDPEKGIEGWSQPLYEEIRTFATEQGLSAEIVNNLVDPAAIKMLNMARLYAKGKVKVQTEKSDKKKAPKRIVKSSATAETTKKVVKTAKAQEPMKRLQKSGTVDDAADAFMARWSNGDED